MIKARLIQQERFRGDKGVYSNSQMNTRLLRKYAWPDEGGLAKLKDQMEKLNMSARAFDRILRVARTIADLESGVSLPQNPTESGYREAMEKAVHAPVLSRHLAETIGNRNLDKGTYGSAF